MSRRRNIRTQTEAELAELEAAEQADEQTPPQATVATSTLTHPGVTALPPATTVEPEGRPAPQVSTHGTARQEEEEEEDEDEDDEQFEQLYKRTTYYIRRTNERRLKKLVRKFKKRPGQQGRTKYELMEEALEYLFEKYRIE